MFPGGISSADMSSAQHDAVAPHRHHQRRWRATFQVQDQSSGYVPGIPNNRNYTLNNIAAVPPGQLAPEAELHAPGRLEVGVLQPGLRKTTTSASCRS